VERREAQRLSHQARAALARLRGGPDRKGFAKRCLASTLAPPAAPSFALFARDMGFAKLGRIDLRREANGG
jgi:hypothetical protein